MSDDDMHEWLCRREALIAWGHRGAIPCLEIRYRRAGKLYGHAFEFEKGRSVNYYVTVLAGLAP